MIRVDEVWMAAQLLDMRMGTEAALARVVSVFGAAHPHHAYVFANRRANRKRKTNPANPPARAVTNTASGEVAPNAGGNCVEF